MVNRYWMSTTDLMDEDTPIRGSDIVDRLNEQDEDITILRGQRADLLAACLYVDRILKQRNLDGWKQSMRDIVGHALASARGKTPVPMDELANIILEYDSDTFSAVGMAVTPAEAHAMAELLFKRFCKVVAESGTFRCDGDVLAYYLDEVCGDDGDGGDDE